MQIEKEMPTTGQLPGVPPTPPSLPRTRPSPRRMMTCPKGYACPDEERRRASLPGVPLMPGSGTPRTPAWPSKSPLPRPHSQSSPKQPGSARILRHTSAQFISRDYDIVERLGEGSFGKVDLVKLRSTGEERVCKVVSTLGMRREELEQMREEVRVLRSLDHPNIVKIHEYAEDRDRAQLILILEYIPGGSCGSLLKKRWHQPLSEPLVARFVRQTLQAVAHSHGRGIVHRDLKPEHMMLTTAKLDGVPDCKIIDFGLAAHYGSSGTGLHSRELTQRVGTPAYMAPEVADRDAAYTSKADIWSVGVSALELLIGKRPFACDNAKRTYERIHFYTDLDTLMTSVGNPLEWHALSSGARDFLRSLLEVEPCRRPTAAEALQHPWLGQGLTACDFVSASNTPDQSRCSSVQPGAFRGRSKEKAAGSEEPRNGRFQPVPPPRRASTESPRPDGSKLHLSQLGSRVLAHLGG